MNKLLLLFFMLPLISTCQDIITFKNGDELNVKVVEVGVNEVKYKKSEDGPQYAILKDSVFMIKYANGVKEVIAAKPTEVRPLQPTEDEKIKRSKMLFEKGRDDAYDYYNGGNGAAWGTLGTTLFLSGIIGLAPAIACSSTPPKQFNLNIPQSAYSKEQAYLDGYMKEAHKTKKRKVWTGWGIATALNIIGAIVIITGQNQEK